jgi:hypothetical protein
MIKPKNYYARTEERKARFIRDAAWRAISEIEPSRIRGTRDIVAIVARYFGVMRSDIAGKSRWWIDVAARQVTMALAYRLTDKSTAQISAYCHHVAHTDVLNACWKYDDILDDLFSDAGISAPRRKDYVRRSPLRLKAFAGKKLNRDQDAHASGRVGGGGGRAIAFAPFEPGPLRNKELAPA